MGQRSRQECGEGVRGGTGLRPSDIDILRQQNLTSERKGLRRIPIIAVTSDTQPETEKSARQAKASRFLVKPFQPGELGIAIRDLLRASLPRGDPLLCSS